MSLTTLILLQALNSAPLVVLPAADLAQFEQTQLDQATLVTFTSAEQAKAAAISMHHLLLAGDWRTGQLVLQLNAADAAKLTPFATALQPATAWRQQQLLQQTERQAAQQAAQPSSTADTSTRAEPVAAEALAGIPGYSCYETVEETYQQAAALAAQYPQYARWQNIGAAWSKQQGGSGYDLYVLILGQQSGYSNKPKLLINSAIHAREYATAGLTLAFAKDLLSKVGKDADVDWMLAQHEVHLVFHTNPEGRKIAETGVLWRKNINNTECANGNYGVDLNRNFSFSWNSTLNGSSPLSCDQTYRGKTKASEAEIKVLESYARSIFADRRGPGRKDVAPADTSGIHLDIHSYSELVLWPYGDTTEPAPNGTALQTLGRKFAWFNNYLPQQAIGLYPTDGTSDSVSYGELGVAAFTFELGTAFFQSCASYQSRVLPDNLAALYYALRVTAAPYMLPAGPEVQNWTLNTNAQQQIAQNQTLQLSFQVSDQQFSQLNGVEPSQVVSQVELYLDQLPDTAAAVAIQPSPTDGRFDQPLEQFNWPVDISQLALGRHTLYMRGKDASQQFGPVYARYFEVIPAITLPQLTVDFQTNCRFLSCTFNNLSSASNGAVPLYSWSFGNGTSSSQTHPTAVFATPGSYLVKLTATIAGGDGARERSVQVFAEPSVSINSNCQNLNCRFTAVANSANGAIQQFNWRINNQPYTGVEVTVNLPQAGSYHVELTVVDNQHQSSTASSQISVTTPVVPNEPAATSGGSAGGFGWLWLAITGCLGLARRRQPGRSVVVWN